MRRESAVATCHLCRRVSTPEGVTESPTRIRPLRQDLSAQSAAMEQALHDVLARDPLQVIAGFAQANAPNADLAIKNSMPTNLIQRHVASDDVAASFTRGEFDVIFAPQRLNRLRLDQREFEIRLGLVERALP